MKRVAFHCKILAFGYHTAVHALLVYVPGLCTTARTIILPSGSSYFMDVVRRVFLFLLAQICRLCDFIVVLPTHLVMPFIER